MLDHELSNEVNQIRVGLLNLAEQLNNVTRACKPDGHQP